ncbi:pyridoxal-phosphate dependent enzyme [Micavibrio aeruginosavorus]|uniref:Pyridoxal-phosphate dependent enzyme family protein n=1 Tax=Micavibrio aeruginosavorus (strain ARL-13) TaxID=856793 RepID=G2KRJ1_MICAA|nr:pyridoxal-phosphate dependent enzyme [Micavibrio aeruginosavorus]AEP09553.1 pyridoxal-phosphate dependent enzyme family protein [Micavibrio aeruginosavorus ARL-13]
MIYDRITDMIGNTPLLKIPAEVHGLKNIDLYAKMEMMNPFGSVKDRVAWGMIRDDIADIQAKGQTIYENSSGNTAKALQLIASTYGVETKLITYLAKVDGVKDIIRMLGAEIEEVLGGSECFDPNDPNDPQFLIEKAVKDDPEKAYFPSQFTNPKNPDIHYQTTGKEIADDLGRVDYFFGGLGTSGSTLGAARRIRDEGSTGLKTIGICASKNDFIPGIRSMDQMWESGLFTKEHYADFVYVDSGEAVDAMMDLVKKCAIMCGPTSGASYLGALKYLRTIDDSLTERKSAVFIVCDRGEWYTDYVRQRRPHLFNQKQKPGSLQAFEYTVSNDQFAVPAAQANTWIAEHNPLIIDVRGNLAFKMMSIPGSINIPWELLEPMIDAADPFAKDRPILLACPVGEKTARYAAYLQSRGYQAFGLGGGMLAWRNEQQKRAA